MSGDVRTRLSEALQLAEDQARAAMGHRRHQVFDGTGIVTMSPTLTGLHRSVVIEGNVATFLRRWDPSTVLRLIERDRQLLADYDQTRDNDFWEPHESAGGYAAAVKDQLERAAAFWLGTPEVDR